MSESFEGQSPYWPQEVVSMALRALNKVWYPYEDEYFWEPGLASTILDTKELPLLLRDPDEIEDYAIIENLQVFVGLIEGIDTIEQLYEFMRQQRDMLLEAREDQMKRLGMTAEEIARYRAKMSKIIKDAPKKFDLGEQTDNDN